MKTQAAFKPRAVTRRMTGSHAIPPCPADAAVSEDGLTIALPPPPSINHQYATVNGRRILSAAGRRYKTTVMQQVLIALSGSACGHQLLRTLRAHRLAISIRFFMNSPLQRDVDSGLKITQDALCEALGLNDNRVFELHLYKELVTTPAYIRVILSPAASTQTL